MAKNTYIAGIAKNGELHQFGIAYDAPMVEALMNDIVSATESANTAIEEANNAVSSANNAAELANEAASKAAAAAEGATVQVFLTQAQYDYLVDNGQIDSATLYNIYE